MRAPLFPAACLFLGLLLVLLPPAGARAQAPAPCAEPLKAAIPVADTHGAPPYPREAETRGEEGTTMLTVTVGTDGAVSDATVARPSGSARLDEAAMSWVKSRFRWQPALQNCVAVASTLPVRVVWRNPFRGAPTVMAEGPAPASWSADVPPGGRRAAGFTLACDVNDIKAVLRLDVPERSADATPVLGIALTNANGPGQLYGPETVLLRLAPFENAKTPAFYMRKDGGRRQSYDLQFPNKVDFGQEIPVEMSWTTDGQVNLTVDWKKTSLAMSVAPAQVTFFAESGTGQIKDIQESWQGRKERPARCE
jgi:protein TonB